MKGLLESFRRKIIKDLKIDHRKPETVKFEGIYKKGVDCWESEYNSSHFNNSPSSRTFVNLVEKREVNPSAVRAKERKERREGDAAGGPTGSATSSARTQTREVQSQPQS